MAPQISLRAARVEDAPLIADFVRQLAIYEKLEHEFVATPADFERDLFGEKPLGEVIFVCENAVEVGFALFFSSYSTFEGRAGIYLEDVFVRPEFRGRGYGKALLIAIARIARNRGCSRFEWSVLDWNEPSKRFYASLGAILHPEWQKNRVSGDALEHLASLAMAGETERENS